MQVTDLMPTPPQVCHPDSDLGTVARMMPDRPPEQVSALRAEALNAPAEDGLMTAARHRGTVKAGQLDASFNAAPELLDAIVDVLDAYRESSRRCCHTMRSRRRRSLPMDS
jgi:hypothetical protein